MHCENGVCATRSQYTEGSQPGEWGAGALGPLEGGEGPAQGEGHSSTKSCLSLVEGCSRSPLPPALRESGRPDTQSSAQIGRCCRRKRPVCPEMASGEGADRWPQQHPLTRGVACSVSDGDVPHRLCALHQPCPAPPARLLLVNGSVSTVS